MHQTQESRVTLLSKEPGAHQASRNKGCESGPAGELLPEDKSRNEIAADEDDQPKAPVPGHAERRP